MRFLLILALVPCSVLAIQARDLVPEAQKLYAQLGAGSPEKRPTALRLADLLFDAALEIHGNARSTTKDLSRADAYRREALRLYLDAKSSLKGMSLLRVKFQISRLYAYAGQMEQASVYWRELSRQKDDANIRRESSLHLAEQLELSNRRESLNEALQLYVKALPLAEKKTLQSYIHYRLGWTYFRLGQASTAVAQVRKSLDLASSREYPDLLKDLVLFLSRESKSAGEQIRLLTEYENEFKSKGLVENLADAFFTADRSEDYVATLKYLNKKNATGERAIAMLDAEHDRLSPKEIATRLEEIRDLGVKNARNEKKTRESLFRLIQYWDGQRRAGRAEFLVTVTDGVGTMILLFPASEESKKSVSGWLAAVPDSKIQLEQLKNWIQEKPAASAELLLRQHRLEVARKEKVWPIVVEESKHLERLTADNRRSVRYQRAKGLYELKKYDEALPLFVQLAREKVKPDEFTGFSRELALDIWAKQKDYASLIENASAWNKPDIRDQALFEQAALAKNNESLKQFSTFCARRQFLPQSCDNAKALAVELRDQTTLIGVLRQQNDPSELARQLEIGARFSESARLLEKQFPAPDFMTGMKIAVLYELQGEMSARDRALHRLNENWRKGRLKLEEAQQKLLLQSLQDAQLIDVKTLDLPWSEGLRLELASTLYLRRPQAAVAAPLLKTCVDYGPGWTKAQLDSIDDLNKQQSRIQFVGAQSQSKFQKRVALLDKMSQQADCFFKGADETERQVVARRVSEAYAEFNSKILATPVPKELDEATVAEVKTQIAEMAAPFKERAANWAKLSGPEPVELPKLTAPEELKVKFDWRAQLEKLQAEPFNKEYMSDLKEHFDALGMKRLAAYMDGRLQGLERQ